MDNRPIGVFDSGVGGLTVVRALHHIMPQEDILYLGDIGRVPYGTRSREMIRKYAVQDMQYLLESDIKAIVAACGTVGAYFLEKDAEDIGASIPYTTIILPAAKQACALSKGGRIGVIATPATIRSGAYARAVHATAPNAQIFGKACPLLVSLIEDGITQADHPIARLTVEMYLKPLMEEEIDTLILGCTHYPLLYDLINEILSYQVTLIDAGAAAIQEMHAAMCTAGTLADLAKTGQTRYCVTDDPERFIKTANSLLHQDISDEVTRVDLEEIESATLRL